MPLKSEPEARVFTGQIHCGAHFVNLIQQKTISAFVDACDKENKIFVVAKVAKFGADIHGKKKEFFGKIVGRLLPKPVETRWTTTYDLIQFVNFNATRVLTFCREYNEMCRRDRTLPLLRNELTETDIGKLLHIETILEPLNRMLNDVCEKKVSAHAGLFGLVCIEDTVLALEKDLEYRYPGIQI